jgi:5-methylcytosine-specific restriction endonuclease McrBC regulatory subunit McrC
MTKIEVKTGLSVVLPTDFLNDIQKELKELGCSHWVKEDNLLKISQGYIGEICGNDYKVLITPSIHYLSTKDYLRLVAYESSLFYDGNDLDFMQSDNLGIYIIDLFLEYIHQLIQEGIPYKYINKVKYNNFFTGNINIEETYMRYMLNTKPVVKTVAQELSINYFTIVVVWQAYNKILQRFKDKKNPYIDRAFLKLEKKEYSKTEINTKKVFFHKNEATLSKAYTFAKLIINNMNISRGEEQLTSSILIDSNSVFEKFVFKLFRNSLPDEPFVYHDRQLGIAFSENVEKVYIEPDILHKGIKTTILDVKNKNFDKHYSNSDFYQIYTYCRAYKSTLGILIYPSVEETKSYKILTRFDSDITLYAVSLNIKDMKLKDRLNAYQSFIKHIMEIIDFQ